MTAKPHNHLSMKYTTLAVLILLTALSPAKDSADYESFEVWKSASPDGSYFSAMRRIPGDEYIWVQDNDGFRLVVFPINKNEGGQLGDLYFKFEKEGRLPVVIKWTADSKFLAFSTESSGGHSPWNCKTYVFSVDTKKVANIDDVIGPVVGSSFTLRAPHTGTFLINSAGDTEHPTEKTLDLALLFNKTPKHKTKQQGAGQPATKPADKTLLKDNKLFGSVLAY